MQADNRTVEQGWAVLHPERLTYGGRVGLAMGKICERSDVGTVTHDEAQLAGMNRMNESADQFGCVSAALDSEPASEPALEISEHCEAARHQDVSKGPPRPRLSAVVVYYDDAEHLSACVDTLLRDPAIAEIVVVDNASPGQAAEAIVGERHRVKVVRSPTNLGFGGGANLGAAVATGDLLVFLNPDTLPDPGCMAALAAHVVERDGIAGPVVRTGAGGAPEYGWTVDRMLLPRASDQVFEPLFVQGCCLATTRSCFDAVGGFDARYFLFQEDVEFCWQALRRGFVVDVVTAAGLVHAGGATAEGGYRRAGQIETSSARILLRERNGWAVLTACAPVSSIPELLILSLLRTVAFAGLLIRYGRPGDAVRLTGGLWWNIVHLRGTLARRRRPGVTLDGQRLAWSRIARQSFLWDLARKGERLRFVDSSKPGEGSHSFFKDKYMGLISAAHKPGQRKTSEPESAACQHRNHGWPRDAISGLMQRKVAAAIQVAQTFINWPEIIWTIAAGHLPKADSLLPPELIFRCRTGPTLCTERTPGSYLPVLEVLVEDVYHLSEVPWSATPDFPFSVLDIGAHVGAFAVQVAARYPGARVLCLEPSPKAGKYLAANIAHNHLSNRVCWRAAAVGSRAGTARLLSEVAGSCGSSILPELAPKATSGIEVKVVDLGTIIAESGGPQLVKLDCEGAEYDIILNSDATLWDNVQCILLKYHGVQGHSWNELETRLVRLGFHLSWQYPGKISGYGTAMLIRSPQMLKTVKVKG